MKSKGLNLSGFITVFDKLDDIFKEFRIDYQTDKNLKNAAIDCLIEFLQSEKE
jgi:hypothetical protein